MLPQAEDRLALGTRQDGFFGTLAIFSNAHQLVCLFTENSSPMGNTYISVHCVNTLKNTC